jgi:hypothetical protein
MAKVLAARGAQGEIVKSLQQRLKDAGFDPGPADGDFGRKTEGVVQALQQARGLAVTGEIDAATWAALTPETPPSLRDRCLQVTAAFEGHGFSRARGNWDGAGLTWGIIGFTLQSGEVGRIVLEINGRNPEVLREAFGSQSEAVLAILRASKKEQMKWADRISLGKNKVRLAEPWRSAFARLGESAVAREIQAAHADRDYFQPALGTVSRYGLTTELGVALAFDIQVQDGGIRAAARRQIERARAAQPLPREQDLRILVAHAVAENARQQQADVLARKLTLATGAGKVHGETYVLRNWGLDESPFAG